MGREFDEVSETQPKYPVLKTIGDYLKSADLTPTAKEFLSGPAKLFETLAYDEPLTTGKGETLHLKPEALELSNFIPPLKGAGAMASIGPIGLRALGEADPLLWKTVLKIKEALSKAPAEDWKLQKSIVEQYPNFFAVPRGRDQYKSVMEAPAVKFGMEAPEAKLHESGLDKLTPDAHVPISEVFDSPRHYKAYPSLKAFSVRYEPKLGSDAGYMNPQNGIIGVGSHSTPQDLLDTLNHEVTHAIQRKEGWPSGTTTQSAKEALQQFDIFARTGEVLPKEIDKQLDLVHRLRNLDSTDKMLGITEGTLAHNEYRRAAGEQLAEAVAQSARQGGGHVPYLYDQPLSKMYDPRVQKSAVDYMINVLNDMAGLK